MHLELSDFYIGAHSWEALRLAIRIQLFDAIRDTNRWYKISEVTAQVDFPEEVCRSLLEIFSTIGVVRVEGEHYQLNQGFAERLLSDRKGYLGKGVQQLEKDFAEHWSKSVDSLRRDSWQKMQKPLVRSDEEIEKKYANFVINSGDFLSSVARRSAHEFIQENLVKQLFGQIVDLGGNDGSFLATILASRPELGGEILDLEPLRSRAEIVIAEMHLQSRLKFRAQNFFVGELPPADCYLCGYIFHDWPEEVCQYLLRKMYRALPQGGMLVIHENLLDHPSPATKLSLYLGHFLYLLKEGDGGRYRTSSEYKKLLEQKGFGVERVVFGTEKSFIIAKKL